MGKSISGMIHVNFRTNEQQAADELRAACLRSVQGDTWARVCGLGVALGLGGAIVLSIFGVC